MVYITQDDADRLLRRASTDKIAAIKELRTMTSAGLKESNTAIETRFAEGGYIQIEDAGSKQEQLIASYMKLNEQMSDVFVKMIELLEEK